MRVATLVLLFGCSGSKGGTDTWAGGEGEGEVAPWQSEPGTLTVDGVTCAKGWDTLIGYCLESGSTFSLDGGGDCEGVNFRATVWLPGDLTWKSASGTASITTQDQWVSASFSGEFVDFLNGDNPVSASGRVWCERP